MFYSLERPLKIIQEIYTKDKRGYKMGYPKYSINKKTREQPKTPPQNRGDKQKPNSKIA